MDFCLYHGIQSIFAGNPDGVRRGACRCRHNQRMSQWEYSKDLEYLIQRSEQAQITCFTEDERGRSSRCPECGISPVGGTDDGRNAAFRANRDVFGVLNGYPLSFGHVVLFPMRITYLRPSPLRGRATGMNNRKPKSRCRLDRGQSCLTAARPQATSVRRQVPHEDCLPVVRSS